MTYTRRHTLAMLGGAAAVSTLAAPALANTKLVVGALRLASHSASFIALERGYFNEAGMDVELRFFDAAQPMAVAIASGDVDFGVTAISGGLISLADKGAVRVIGGALQEEPGIDGQKYLVSDAAFQAGVKTPKDMNGKRFAVTTAGSSFHYMGAKMAAAEGITLSYTPLQKVGNIVGALKSGQVDGWSIVPHIAKGLAASGAVHVIGDVATYLPNYQVTTVFTSLKNTTDNRGATSDFLKVFSRGIADYNAALIDNTVDEAERTAVLQQIHKYVGVDDPFEKAAAAVVAGAMRLNPDAGLSIASVQDQLDWFKSEELVDSSITIDTLVDPSFVAQI